MEEFLMVFRSAVGDSKPTPEQIEATEKQWSDWFGSFAAQGRYVTGLRPGMEGKTISAASVTDGPYAEVKEILLGAAVIRAASIDEAVQIAKGCPVLQVGGTVEVRDIMLMKM